jgi:alcohol dehydrogenase YqhD (iron-dependent ADH family)
MWAGTIAHNNLLSTGRVADWGSHMVEHELSASYDIAHGAGLAVIFPAWMKYFYKKDLARFAQLASRVWGIEHDFFEIERTALAGIARLESYWASLGLAVRLSGLGIGAEKIPEMADKVSAKGTKSVGNFAKVGKAEAEAIYRLAL